MNARLLAQRAFAVVAASVILSTGAVATSSVGVVHADSCVERMPWFSVTSGEFQTAAGGTLALVAAPNAVPTLAAGGATAAVPGGNLAAMAAAFLGASAATCALVDFEINGHSIGGWIDGLTGYRVDLPPPIITHSQLTHHTMACDGSANYLVGFNSNALIGSSVPDYCRYVWMRGFAEGRVSRSANANTTGRYVASNIVERTIGGNVLPGRPGTGPYEPVDGSGDSARVFMCNGSTAAACNTIGPSTTGGTWLPDTLLPAGSGSRRWGDAQTATERVAYACITSANPGPLGGIGGVCGVPPGRVWAVVDGQTDTIEAVFAPFPLVNSHGWQRRWVVDVRCTNFAASNANSYRRVESPPFWDATMDQRAPIPRCSAGTTLTAFRIAQVPQQVACPGPSNSGMCADRYLVNTWTAPEAWFSTGTRPAWVECLKAGNDCDEPQTDGVTCTWNGATVGMEACDPAEQTKIDEAVKTQGQLDETPAPADGVISTLDPNPSDDPGDPGSIITFPIDTGDDTKCADPSQTSCDPLPVELDAGDECWPNGWGWFNPAQWVLRPIKCALVWAFVPSEEDVIEFVDDLREGIEGTFPFSLMVDLHGVLDTFVEAAVDSSSACFELDETPLTPDGECVAIPSGLLTASQRSLVGDVIVGALVLGLIWSAVRLVTSESGE